MRAIGILVLATLLFAPAAWGDDPELDAAQEAALSRLEENRASYQSAQERLAALEAEYARGMTSRNLIGAPRSEVVAGIAKARQALAATRAAHDSLFEAARRSGVPWGLLGRYETLPAAPAAPEPTLEDSPDDVTVGSENTDAVGEETAEDSDAMEDEGENLDRAPDSDGEGVGAVEQGGSEDSDDLRATSRDLD